MPPGWACPKCRCRLLRVRFGPPGRTDKVYFECDQNPKRCRWRSERPMPYDEYMNRERAAEAAGLDRIPLDDWP